MLREALQGNREGNKGKIEVVDHADPSDRATAELEINFNLRRRERNKGLVRKIEQAKKYRLHNSYREEDRRAKYQELFDELKAYLSHWTPERKAKFIGELERSINE